MRVWPVIAIAGAVLAGCGDPLRDVDRLSDIDVDAAQPAPKALPDAEELKRKGGLSGLFKSAGAPSASQAAPSETIAASEPSKPGIPPVTGKTPAPAIETAQSDAARPDPENRVDEIAATETATPDSAKEGAEPARKGLIARMFRRPRTDPKPEPEAAEPADVAIAAKPAATEAPEDAAQSQAPVKLAALSAPDPDGPKAQPRKRWGLLGFARKNADPVAEPAPESLPPAGNVPYGALAKVCGLSKRDLGKEVARHPERSRSGYRVYDTAPGETTPRAFYVTGFKDGCARKFTAALAVFGSPVMHEYIRYGLPSKVQPYSATDPAYEKLKARECKVPRKKPCGSRIGRLEKSTTFLTIYENFGSNSRWANVLLHNGKVLATDIKGG